MANEYAVSMDFWPRIQTKIRNWEITHGRSLPKDQYEALVSAEMGVSADQAAKRNVQGRAIALEEEKMDLAKDQAEKAERAATIKGAVDVATLGGTGYLAYKGMENQAAQVAANTKLIDSIIAGGSGAAKPAVDIAGAGAFSAPTAEGAGFTLGGQAALEAPTLATETSFAAPAIAEAGAAEAAGAAGGGAAVEGAAASVAPYMAPAGAGFAGASLLAKPLSKLPGIGDTGGAIIGGAAAGAAAGSFFPGVGTVVGGIIGAGAGLVQDLAGDSIICTELYRQKRISLRTLLACHLFRRKYIGPDMFQEYLLWAAPIVAVMERRGLGNRLLLPFTTRFVSYMVAIVRGKKPTRAERAVWRYVMWRYKARRMFRRLEVAHA
jgi:hypothetical protein